MGNKLYGNRWKTVGNLTEGGQAVIFLVEDTTKEYESPCVLKRIKDPKRRGRFKAEIEAGERLSHPNIMPIIDSSTLDYGENEKLYLVMPHYAEEGDLSKRPLMYKDSIDSTMIVAKKLAEALLHAHKNKVVHRDVKPENILFRENNNDCLLSDFGICLIRDLDRSTETSEVVGPLCFMAPELEGGGQLGVDCSVDIYSLGKVIYFMLSGGVRLPRELHREKEYDLWSGKGGRYTLLGLLLDKMICPVDQRIKSMEDVMSEIEKIQDWEKQQSSSFFTSDALNDIASVLSKKNDEISERERQQAERKNREIKLDLYLDTVESWLRKQFEAEINHFNNPPNMVGGFADPNNHDNFRIRIGASQFLTGKRVFGIEISMPNNNFFKKHFLLFYSCPKHNLNDIYIIPIYQCWHNNNIQKGIPSSNYFFDTNNKLKSYKIDRRGHIIDNNRNLATIDLRNILLIKTTTSDWPNDQVKYIEVIKKTLEVFIRYLGQK